jgi:hypothetical protein
MSSALLFPDAFAQRGAALAPAYLYYGLARAGPD